MKMRLLLWLFLSGGLAVTQVFAGEVIEVDVHGMTCAFCVDAVQRNLQKLPDVERVELSLKLKKVKIHGKENSLDLDRIRQAIVDSGFTPITVRRLSDEK